MFFISQPAMNSSPCDPSPVMVGIETRRVDVEHVRGEVDLRP